MRMSSASGFPAPPLADQFTSYLLPGEAELLRGTASLHTDTNPHNIMIGNGGVAHVVDPACAAVRLRERGRSPAAAGDDVTHA